MCLYDKYDTPAVALRTTVLNIMYRELLSCAISIVILLVVVQFSSERQNRKTIVSLVTILYMSGIIYFTMIRGSREGLSGINTRFPFPFYRAIKSGHYGLTTNRSVLNLLLFVPFGYLIPQLVITWKPAWWKITIFGFLTSLLIVTTQLIFHRGVFELDDLVKNTMGAAVGWVIWRAMYRENKHASED